MIEKRVHNWDCHRMTGRISVTPRVLFKIRMLPPKRGVRIPRDGWETWLSLVQFTVCAPLASADSYRICWSFPLDSE